MANSLSEVIYQNVLYNSLKCNISKKLRNQVYFVFASKHQSLLQGGDIGFGGHDQAFTKCPK